MQGLEAAAKKYSDKLCVAQAHHTYLIILHFTTLYQWRLCHEDAEWDVSCVSSCFLHFLAQRVEEWSRWQKWLKQVMMAVQPPSAGRIKLYPSCIYDYSILQNCHQSQLPKRAIAPYRLLVLHLLLFLRVRAIVCSRKRCRSGALSSHLNIFSAL